MNLKKSGLILVLLFLVSIFAVSCADAPREGIGLDDIWEKMISIGKLEFLGFTGEKGISGFIRLMVGILIFALLYEASSVLKLSRNISIVIALVLAIMSSILIPGSVLIGISSAYSTLVAVILISIPVLGGGYLLYRIPSNNSLQIVIKIVIILLMIMVLRAVKSVAITLT